MPAENHVRASLRGSADVVATDLALEVAERVSIAGVEVVEDWTPGIHPTGPDRPHNF